MSPAYEKDGRAYRVAGTGIKAPSSNFSVLECPYCAAQFRAYWWSIAGGGKKCPGCGAMHTNGGLAYRAIKKSK